jgi:RimJ/RimL family protein N-acetyltransferase
MTERLETGRLVLRRPEARDWGPFRDFMLSDRSAAFGSHGDLGRAFRAFAAELGHWEIFGHGMWAVTLRDDDTAVGLVGPWTPPDWPENEIGWMILAPGLEGSGVATEAARAALAHAFDVLGWPTAVSYVGPGNLRSVRLAEKLGAVLDPQAPQPRPEDPVLVYRHRRPVGVAA